MKASEKWCSSTIYWIFSTRAMAMMVTSGMEMASATAHSVSVSLALARSLWRSMSLWSSASKMAS
jgi:hypothetical protein